MAKAKTLRTSRPESTSPARRRRPTARVQRLLDYFDDSPAEDRMRIYFDALRSLGEGPDRAAFEEGVQRLLGVDPETNLLDYSPK